MKVTKLVAAVFLSGLIIGVSATAASADSAYSVWLTPTNVQTGVMHTSGRSYVQSDSVPGAGGVQVKRTTGATIPTGYANGGVTLTRVNGTVCGKSPSDGIFNSGGELVFVAYVLETCPSNVNVHAVTYWAMYNTNTGDYQSWIPAASPYVLMN